MKWSFSGIKGYFFMERARMQSVYEFEGEMWVNGWQLRKKESWEWKPVKPGHRGLYKPHKELGFMLRKLRSFKGPRHMTDTTKFLFWNARTSCRLAILEGGKPVSKHLKWDGTMVRSSSGCPAPVHIHSAFVHLCQRLMGHRDGPASSLASWLSPMGNFS